MLVKPFMLSVKPARDKRQTEVVRKDMMTRPYSLVAPGSIKVPRPHSGADAQRLQPVPHLLQARHDFYVAVAFLRRSREGDIEKPRTHLRQQAVWMTRAVVTRN